MLKYLRIAFSVACATAFVLLIILWVRSYTIIDVAHLKLSGYVLCRISSFQGRLNFRVDRMPVLNEFPPRNPHRDGPSFFWSQCGWWSSTIQDYANGSPIPRAEFPWFGYVGVRTMHVLTTPIWFWLIICGASAWVSWTRTKWNFSLRMLLIAATIVGVVLGLIAWSCRA
jgi:hypothetical protein